MVEICKIVAYIPPCNKIFDAINKYGSVKGAYNNQV